jgi:hypothetical protein
MLNRLSLPGLTWLDAAIHPFRKKMDARVPQTSLRGLRKLDCVPAHDGEAQRFNSSGIHYSPINLRLIFRVFAEQIN